MVLPGTVAPFSRQPRPFSRQPRPLPFLPCPTTVRPAGSGRRGGACCRHRRPPAPRWRGNRSADRRVDRDVTVT